MLNLFANGGYVPVQVGKFPAGEVYVKVENVQQVVYPHRRVSIEWQFQGSDSVIELAMLTNALYEACGDLQITLYCPYFPGARQDRVVEEGEAFGLRVYADIIKALGFKKIITEDLHSDVLPGMLPPQMLCNKKQHELWGDNESQGKSCIVAPDAGAAKKAQKLADKWGVMCYVASKVRDTIGGVKVSFPHDLNCYDDVYVVDDICDGGATFIALAKEITSQHNYKCKFGLHLRVTHGIFSKGREELSRYFSTIKCINNMEKQQ